MKFILMLITSIAVTAHAQSTSYIQQAARDACKCLEAPYAQTAAAMSAIKKAQQSGDMAKLLETQAQMMSVLQASSSCFEALSKKYPDIDQNDDLKKEVLALTQKMCPNPATAN